MAENEEGSGKKLGGLLKKAVTIGAATYASAEDAVSKTLNTVQLPREFLRDSIETLFKSYTITVNAEIKLTPKKEAQTGGEK